MKDTLAKQYLMVCDARGALLNFCEMLSDSAFIRSSPDVGNGGNIRDLLVHVCNTYHSWLANFALQQPLLPRAEASFITVADCSMYFNDINRLVSVFLDTFDQDYGRPIERTIDGQLIRRTPLELFTHVITHEFHHKGQVLTLSRMWGHVPVDTDIIR